MRGSSSQGAFMLVALIGLVINGVFSAPNLEADLAGGQVAKIKTEVVLQNEGKIEKIQPRAIR